MQWLLSAFLARIHATTSSPNPPFLALSKISDAERAYLQRKMVVSKAAQLANADCRKQFTAVRSFFESLHQTRKTSLRQSYERSLKIMALQHKLCRTDARVMALEQQSAERMFRQKESNLNAVRYWRFERPCSLTKTISTSHKLFLLYIHSRFIWLRILKKQPTLSLCLGYSMKSKLPR